MPPVLPKVDELSESEILILTYLYESHPRSITVKTMRHLIERPYAEAAALCKKFAALELITLTHDAPRSATMCATGRAYVEARDITSLA